MLMCKKIVIGIVAAIATITAVGEDAPATAVWTGSAGDGDAANAANWACCDASGEPLPAGTMPASGTDVTIAGDGLAVTASPDAPLSFKSVKLENCTLGADCDLRGLGAVAVPSGSTIDLNGFTLKIPSFSGTGTITNNREGEAAELYACIASGASLRNSDTAISGNLKLVKEGKGTFAAAKQSQKYTGGTVVKDGTIQCTARGDFGLFGSNLEVTVDPGGVFDVNGYVVYNNYKFVLNGGTLMSSTAYRNAGWTMWGNVRLTADSTIKVQGTYGFCANSYAKTTLDLGGHELQVETGGSATTYFQLYSTEILNGSLKGSSGGYIRSYSDSKNELGSSTLDLKAAMALWLEKDLNVRNYTASNKWTGSNQGGSVVKVSGTFKPTAQSEGCYHSCYMLNGSTMDLTDWPSGKGWPMYSRFTTGGRQLSFANGTVNVKLDAARSDIQSLARKTTDGNYSGYLLKWGTSSTTLATRNANTAFVLDETSAKKYELVQDATGLLLRPKTGFSIRIAENRDVTIPGDWVVDKTGESFGSVDVDEWLAGKGANGLPRWQSWLFKLEPGDAASVVVCKAGETQPADGTFAIGANLDVQAGSGAEVTAYLDKSVDGTQWAQVGDGQSVTSGTVTFGTSLSGGENRCFFRIRVAVR